MHVGFAPVFMNVSGEMSDLEVFKHELALSDLARICSFTATVTAWPGAGSAGSVTMSDCSTPCHSALTVTSSPAPAPGAAATWTRQRPGIGLLTDSVPLGPRPWSH